MSQLCESEEQITQPLYCRYVFIQGIMPIQAEILHEEPYVVVFHRLVSKFDSNRVIKLMEPYEKPAVIGGFGSAVQKNSAIRNSSSGILEEPAYTQCIIKKWYPAIKTLSGLNITVPAAEKMAITHYETGGYYTVHYDSEMNNEPHVRRLGTFLLYLSGNYRGGNTIFPHMQLAFTPQQGDGLLFYSHLTNTLLDEKTLHMGCPLKDGNKWIGSLWIRNFTQAGPAATCYGDGLYVKPGFLQSSF
uniref:Prolyl 4-hydroxylase alpha subunit domain-containing protein n=1 Tax=Plectus sambesii TaxID=2011161 RepID=A0A914X8C7_9BILA